MTVSTATTVGQAFRKSYDAATEARSKAGEIAASEQFTAFIGAFVAFYDADINKSERGWKAAFARAFAIRDDGTLNDSKFKTGERLSTVLGKMISGNAAGGIRNALKDNKTTGKERVHVAMNSLILIKKSLTTIAALQRWLDISTGDNSALGRAWRVLSPMKPDDRDALMTQLIVKVSAENKAARGEEAPKVGIVKKPRKDAPAATVAPAETGDEGSDILEAPQA